MWKYYRQLLSWAFSKTWAIVAAIDTAIGIIGGIIAWASPRLEAPMRILLWLIPAGALFVIFVIRAIKAPYHFHQEQQKVIGAASEGPSLDIKIGGMWLMGAKNETPRIQLAVTVANSGRPTTAHGWELIIKTSSQDMKTLYMPGLPPRIGSLNLPQLDDSLHRPLGTNDDIIGILNFVLPKTPRDELDKVIYDKTTKLVLSVLDNTNRKWEGERSISEMAAELFIEYPEK